MCWTVVTKVNSSEDAIVCNANVSVDLYNNNVKRLATRSGGNSQDGVIIHGNASNSSVNLYTESTIRAPLCKQ